MPSTSSLFSTLSTSWNCILPSAFLMQDDKNQTTIQSAQISCPGEAQEAIENPS